MRRLEWFFDFVSPFAYLQSTQLERLPVDVELVRVPVLFAGLLKAWGTLGPAEVAPKRRFTYRYLQWYADRRGIAFRMPPAHPFNPLTVLRLAVALDCRPEVVEAIFGFIWKEGRLADIESERRALAQRLGVPDIDELAGRSEVKARLRDNTERAVALGVFGVPTFVLGTELFWGHDATDMLLDFLADGEGFETAEMQRISALPAAAVRGR